MNKLRLITGVFSFITLSFRGKKQVYRAKNLLFTANFPLTLPYFVFSLQNLDLAMGYRALNRLYQQKLGPKYD